MKPPGGLLKSAVFSLVPLLALVAASELAFRLSGWADSPIAPFAFPAEAEGLTQLDEHLFWSLQPRQDLRFVPSARRGRKSPRSWTKSGRPVQGLPVLL